MTKNMEPVGRAREPDKIAVRVDTLTSSIPSQMTVIFPGRRDVHPPLSG